MALPAYENLLTELRRLFPASERVEVRPGRPDPLGDCLVAALREAGDLATAGPLLGETREPDYAAARRERLGEQPAAQAEVISQLVDTLQGMLSCDHPLEQMHVKPLPTIASVVGTLLAAVYNPNLCSDESARVVSEAEVGTVAMTAELIGYDPGQSGGLFTFGGTGALLYGVKIGLEKAVPGCAEHGLSGRPAIIASQASHYACRTVAGWLGIGYENLRLAATREDSSVDLASLEALARGVLQEGRPLAAIVATVGTTDAFGIDDLAAIAELRDRLVDEWALPYRPHIHADAVIGWAWSVLADYDWQRNPLELPHVVLQRLGPMLERLRALPLADSVGIDFHKTGFAPYVSSLMLVREQADLALLARQQETAPYLFNTGENHPGLYTLETTRSAGGALAALASLRLLGRDGLRTLLAHGIQLADLLARELADMPGWAVLNRAAGGASTLFRGYPEGTDAAACLRRECDDPGHAPTLEANNELNRRIFQRLRQRALAGRGPAIGLTSCWRNSAGGVPICGLSSFVLSPWAEASHMQEVLDEVEAARQGVLREREV